jgi:hypothetical protein
MTEASEREDDWSDLFGNYKAEWLGERIFAYFRKPAYFPDLERPRPCVLIGGRGTGKTTVLRTLSYEGQFGLNRSTERIHEWPYYGFYYRVNTNRVTAFKGPELPDGQWRKLFGHYLNLVLCQQIVKFLLWFEGARPDLRSSDVKLWRDVSGSLNLPEASSLEGLQSALHGGLRDFEAMLNNLKGDRPVPLSLQGAPIDILIKGLKARPHFAGKHFFFLLDEYENLLDDQQVVVNTLLKHATGDYTFKIGVRELGWRRRNTLSGTEELTSPADYVRVDIADRLGAAEFKAFAKEVCDSRLRNKLGETVGSIVDFFPAATSDEEARFLGAETKAVPIRRSLRLSPDPRIAREADVLSDLDVLLIELRSKQRSRTLDQVLRERLSSPDEWQTFVENYRYAALFQIADPVADIVKLYSGWTTYTTLAASNIRYLLELVDNALREHRAAGGEPGEPISWEAQTRAAQFVGRKNLFELEGFREGALLVRLTGGLGRMFQVMARQPAMHAPEQNQFALSPTLDVPPELKVLLDNAIMHSALVRDFGSKLNKEDARSYDYSLHPIFSAFFGISHRRKRKITIRPHELLALVHDTQRGLARLLRKQKRSIGAEPLPSQMQLFEGILGDPA